MFKRSLAVSLLLVSAPSIAADLSYNYLELGYQWFDIDGTSADASGLLLGGAAEVGESWFLTGGYANADVDGGIDTDTISLGMGYHAPLTDSVDLVGTLSYVRADVSVSGFGSGDDDGFAITAGLRGMLTDRVELAGSLGYVDFGDSSGGDGTSINVSALYNFTANVAGGVFLGFDDDVTGYGIGARWYFD
jgi:hypothetical protein